MKTYLDCIPCFMNQALRAARTATNDEAKIKLLLNSVGCMIKEIPINATPPETGDWIYQKVSEITGVADPYQNIKKASICEALQMYDDLKMKVLHSDDPLLTAIRLAIAGNVIDLGVASSYNLAKDVDTILTQDFAIFDYDQFKTGLKNARSILYIGDNAGESVFDRILIEELGKPVTFVVRDKPTINDVTFVEAQDSGLESVSKIISSGSSAPGTILNRCSEEFLEHYHKTDLVISKGQGNYEGLSETTRPVFFLLKAKCSIIAKNLGVKKGDIIFKSVNL